MDAPRETSGFAEDCERYSRYWASAAARLAKLPPKPSRGAEQAREAGKILRETREARSRFLAAHAGAVYDRLTGNRSRFVRVEDLVYDAAAVAPGLVPTREQVDAESARAQRDKDGIEIDQGIFASAVLADAASGRHLCHAMLLPRAESLERLKELEANGRVDLGAAEVIREGKASYVVQKNPRHLNAEDNTTLDAAEIATDLAILDPETAICVLRGDVVQSGKFSGRRVLGSGINLTHLYHGKISYVWYIKRDMGLVNKLFRGVAQADKNPDEVYGGTNEKPWVGAVEGFAIGGGCQLLLALDYVLAAGDAYMTLPARKEGIIPGAANLRLWRFTGDRIARQAILYGRRLDCDTPEGKLICDEVAPAAAFETALDTVVEGFTCSGVVSAAGNRRAIRVSEEPLDLFRRYMAVYAREQAYCHFSPALMANLERHWNAQNRKP